MVSFFVVEHFGLGFWVPCTVIKCKRILVMKWKLGLCRGFEGISNTGTGLPRKFPKEDEYSKYLSEHGGDSNAFTMSEYTTYYFKAALATCTSP